MASLTARLRSGAAAVLPDPGPSRVLATATFVNTVGNGLFLTIAAIFFTRSVGLSVAQVGVGLTVAAVVGFCVSAPLGHLADRVGPREVMLVCGVLQAGTAVALVFVHSFWPFLLAVCAAAAADRGESASRGAVIAGALPGESRVRTRAYLRAVTNVGISLGAVVAGVALAADTRAWYVALILVDAVTYLVAAGIGSRLAHLVPVPVTGTGPRLLALRDRPYLVYTALAGVLTIHYGLLEIAMPLWVVLRTDAPRSTVAALFLINTVMVVLFQVRASRGTEEIAPAARAQARAGLLIAVACLLFAAAGGRSAWVAVAVLVTAGLVHVGGELLQAAGSWGLSYALAPTHAQGQYQGVTGMGFGLGQMVTPILVTTLAIRWGTPGWVLLAAIFAGSGLAVPPVARWAARNRPFALPPPG